MSCVSHAARHMMYAQVQASASTLEMDSEEYRQLSTKCWSKFYSCCREYEELVSRPLAMFQDPGTGMGVLLKQGVVSFLKPAELSERDGGGMDLALLAVKGGCGCGCG